MKPTLTGTTSSVFQSNWTVSIFGYSECTHATICFSCSFNQANCLSLAVAKIVFARHSGLLNATAPTPNNVTVPIIANFFFILSHYYLLLFNNFELLIIVNYTIFLFDFKGMVHSYF